MSPSPVPIRVPAIAQADVRQYLPQGKRRPFLEAIKARLEHFPLAGRRCEPPDGFAHHVRVDRWVVYYEAILSEDQEAIVEVCLLRIVPDVLVGVFPLHLAHEPEM